MKDRTGVHSGKKARRVYILGNGRKKDGEGMSSIVFEGILMTCVRL